MNNQNQSKFNKGISSLIGILIIAAFAVLAGGILAWQYFKPEVKITQKEAAPVEKPKPEDQIKDENLKACDKIQKPYSKDLCYKDVAIAKQDPSL